MSMEPYSGNPFVNTEIVEASQRHVGVQFHVQAMVVEFGWTLNQDVLFSSALTGKPSRKESFNEYHWDHCVIGNQEDYVMATQHQEWVGTLMHGNLWSLKNQCDDLAIFAPANNTDYRNVSGYLEAFWGYMWLAACHTFNPLVGSWKMPKHSGLKEFVGQAITLTGREQLKPTTECLRGVATYAVALSDLMNLHCDKAVSAIGDVVEMLLSISLSSKDAMLDWEWLGVDVVEWPRWTIDGEIYRIEHLAYASNMVATL